MPQYCVNKTAQLNGDHEVHAQGCIFWPHPVNTLSLDWHEDCRSAMQTARAFYRQAAATARRPATRGRARRTTTSGRSAIAAHPRKMRGRNFSRPTRCACARSSSAWAAERAIEIPDHGIDASRVRRSPSSFAADLDISGQRHRTNRHPRDDRRHIE